MSAGSPIFISYSANCEDVILNRLFGSRNCGFYIDVGAAHPLYENDTKALYGRGWRGINIEPSARFYQELNAQRPRDRNINAAVSDTPGRLIFHEVIGTGLSTCDPDEAERAAAKGFEVVCHTVDAVSLRQILEEEVPPEIDLLKVDVEGFELKVLSSNDWRRFRPKLILSEATFPESPCRRPDVVTPYLAEQGYRRVYFDGLNDYYIERDFEPPSEVFDRPPNVFDHFQPYALHRLTLERDNAKVYTSSLEKALRRITHAAQAFELDVDNARIELRAMHERSRALAAQLETITAQQAAVTAQLEAITAQQAQQAAVAEELHQAVLFDVVAYHASIACSRTPTPHASYPLGPIANLTEGRRAAAAVREACTSAIRWNPSRSHKLNLVGFAELMAAAQAVQG